MSSSRASPSLAEQLRGSLKGRSIDARRLVMVSKNSACMRLRAMVMVGVSPADVATLMRRASGNTSGAPVNEDQSNFALRRGNQFERIQSQSGAARMIAALQEAGILENDENQAANIPEDVGGPMNNPVYLRRAAALTATHLRKMLSRERDARHVLIQPCLALRYGDGNEVAWIRPDYMIGGRRYDMPLVVEQKSFVFLHTLTDEKQVSTAAAQAGVYSVAYEGVLRDLGDHRAVPAQAVLLFRRQGGSEAVANLHAIDRDITVARKMLGQRPRSLAEVRRLLGHNGRLDDPVSVARLPFAFSGSCRSFCAMAPVCQQQARQCGSPSVLGPEVEDLIGPVGDIASALALLDGAPPADDAQAEVQQQLRAALAELGRVA